MNIDDFIKRAKEKAEEYKYRASFFESSNPMNTACIKVAKEQGSDDISELDGFDQKYFEVVGNKFDYKFDEGGVSQ